jgi:hypothetical protein
MIKKLCSFKGCIQPAHSAKCWECGKPFCELHSRQSSKHREGRICLAKACARGHEEPAVWRLNIAPNRNPAYTLAIEHGVAGIGWKMSKSQTKTPVSWDDFTKHAERYNHGHSWRSDLETFANKLAKDDLVWTRSSTSHKFYLGRITGPWRYCTEREFWQSGLVNVRDCEWKEVSQHEVPGSLFHLRNATIREVKGLREHSKAIYNRQTHGKFRYKPSRDDQADIWSNLSPDDLEDAVGIYLQFSRGYILHPSTCKNSTPKVEYFLRHRRTQDLAYVQVKTGKSVIELNQYADDPGNGFFFAPTGTYRGQTQSRMTILQPYQIEEFLRNNRGVLTEKLKLAVSLSEKGALGAKGRVPHP